MAVESGSSGRGEDAIGVEDAVRGFVGALLCADDQDGVPARGVSRVISAVMALTCASIVACGQAYSPCSWFSMS